MSKDWLMYQRKELVKKLQAHVPLHGSRLDFIVRFVIQSSWTNGGCNCGVVRGVTLSTVASALNPGVLPESNEKRIKRFFGEVKLEGTNLARLVLALVHHLGQS